MKPIFDIQIPLFYEIGGEKQPVKVLTVNHMYATNFTKFRWKRFLTGEAKRYKQHLEEAIQERISEYKQEFDIKDKNFFYIVDFYIHIPLTKSWEFNKTYLVDLDGLIKPIQDALSTKKDVKWVWNDDKQVLSFLPSLHYVKTIDEAKIDISIYEENDNILQLLNDFKSKIKSSI